MIISKIIVSAPGRICLFGEHMDWCRHKVLACAVDMRSFVEAEVTSSKVAEVFSYSPFTVYDKFEVNNAILNWNSDLKYVGGVLRAFQKKKDLPYILGGMKMRFLRV